MMDRLAERGENLGGATSGLLQMLDRVGAELLERAVGEVVARDRLRLRDVHHEIDRLRFEAGLPTPLSVTVTSDARALTPVRTHALSTYDRLQNPKGGDDDDALF